MVFLLAHPSHPAGGAWLACRVEALDGELINAL